MPLNSPESSPACWVLIECPRGKILRESLEALSVGLSLQKQYRIPVTAVWAGMAPEAWQAQLFAAAGIGYALGKFIF